MVVVYGRWLTVFLSTLEVLSVEMAVIKSHDGISAFALPLMSSTSLTSAYPIHVNTHIKESTIPNSVLTHVFIMRTLLSLIIV